MLVPFALYLYYHRSARKSIGWAGQVSLPPRFLASLGMTDEARMVKTRSESNGLRPLSRSVPLPRRDGLGEGKSDISPLSALNVPSDPRFLTSFGMTGGVFETSAHLAPQPTFLV